MYSSPDDVTAAPSSAFIDLRSDTVTKPSPEMRRAMFDAEVGDDVYGEDPTINRLEKRAAEIFGSEAAIFVPSGTMGNQIAIKLHTTHGQEVICEERGHVFNYEMAMMAHFSGCLARPIHGEDGILRWPQIERKISPKTYYYAQTGLVSLESTHNMAGGTVYPQAVADEICDGAHAAGLPVHLDGARIFNASVTLSRPVAEITRKFDSVMFCLSKGLGAPVGSLLVGSKQFITQARVYRKALGGGMRQAGVLAAAGLYALEHNVTRLPEDHEKASYLARELSGVRGFDIDLETVQTNIIIIGAEKAGRSPEEMLAALRSKGVLLTLGNYMGLRAVTHLDVSMEQVRQAGRIIRETLN